MKFTALMGFDIRFNMTNGGDGCVTTCSPDKKRFKELTSQPRTVCIIGRRTFEHDFAYKVPKDRHFIVYDSTTDVAKLVRDLRSYFDQVYIIGGARTYNVFYALLDEIDYSVSYNTLHPDIVSAHDVLFDTLHLKDHILYDQFMLGAGKKNPLCTDYGYFCNNTNGLIGYYRVLRLSNLGIK